MYEKPSLEELVHSGVLGMKWGHHKSPTSRENIMLNNTTNMSKWGSDKNHNILYITGFSGSGKSTLAKNMSDKNTNVIHLDSYLERGRSDKVDPEFNKYIAKHYPRYKELTGVTFDTEVNREIFMKHTENFARGQYPNKKVVIEGLQLIGRGVYKDKSFFKDKPLVIMDTGATTSFLRSVKRDKRGLIKTLLDSHALVDEMMWYDAMKVQIKELKNEAKTKKGREWADNYLTVNGNKSI